MDAQIPDIPPRCDVLIVGAGPAGCAAAKSLSKSGLHVILIDRLPFPRRKVCDGLLFPEAIEFLHTHFPSCSDWIVKNSTPIHGIQLHFRGKDSFQLPFSSAAAKVEREKFDHTLAESCGVPFFHPVSFTSLVRDNGGIQARLKREERLFDVRSKFLIGADGANGKVLQAIDTAFFKKHVEPFQFFSGRISLRSKTVLQKEWWHSFFLRSAGAYNIVTPLGNTCEIEVSLKDKESFQACYSHLLEHLEIEGFLSQWEERGKEFCIGNQMASRKKFYLGKGPVLLGGEAAGFVFWLGLGIAPALYSGYYAARAVLESLARKEKPVPLYGQQLRDFIEKIRKQHSLFHLLFGDVGEMDFKKAFQNRVFWKRWRYLFAILKQLAKFQ